MRPMPVATLARSEQRSSQITVIQPRRLPRVLGALATYVGVTLLAVIFLVPLLFEFVGSIKPNDRVLSEGSSWRAFVPTAITFENYGDALARADLARLFINSLIITSSIVAAGIVFNSLFGYALARMTFRVKSLLVWVVLALIIIHVQAIAVTPF